MERKLASIQRIEELKPIEGADRIELAKVQGWYVIVSKGDYEVGSRCIYFEIDSVIPQDIPDLVFMEKHKWRVKTMKMKGVMSQGLCAKLDILPVHKLSLAGMNIGADVTDLLGVKLYDPETTQKDFHANKGQNPEGKFPTHLVPKTDEPRLQSSVKVLQEIPEGTALVATQKLDGTSATYAVSKVPRKIFGVNWFGLTKTKRWVCSRNLSLHVDKTTAYYEMDRKYGILDELEGMAKNSGVHYAIQGEIVGPGIQKNPLGLKEKDFFMYGMYNIDTKEYISHDEVFSFARVAGMKTVPEMFRTEYDPVRHDLNWWLSSAQNGVYPNGSPQEGIVARAVKERQSEVLQGRLSFKVVSDKYLLNE